MPGITRRPAASTCSAVPARGCLATSSSFPTATIRSPQARRDSLSPEPVPGETIRPFRSQSAREEACTLPRREPSQLFRNGMTRRLPFLHEENILFHKTVHLQPHYSPPRFLPEKHVPVDYPDDAARSLFSSKFHDTFHAHKQPLSFRGRIAGMFSPAGKYISLRGKSSHLI